MRRTTALAAVAVFAVLLGGLVVGLVHFSESGGTLEEQWVSDTARDHEGNHHPVAVVPGKGGADVIAPINDAAADAAQSETSCSLVRLDGSGGDAEWRTGMPVEHCHGHTFSDPLVADLNGDGSPEVLVGTGRRALVAYDGADGAELWDREFESIGYSVPVLANLTDAPGEEVVAVDFRGNAYAVAADGTPLWNRSLPGTVWADPAAGDFDGDGAPEIAVASDEGVAVLSRNGTVESRADAAARWMTDADVDADERPELLVAGAAGDGGFVAALDPETGDRTWTVRTEDDSAVGAVADGNGDGDVEAYVSVRGGRVLAVDAASGEREWETELTAGSDTILPPPVLGDVGGDGAPELTVASADGLVAVLDPRNGDELAAYERDVPAYARPTLADLDGDGSDEVLVIFGDGRVVALSYSA